MIDFPIKKKKKKKKKEDLYIKLDNSIMILYISQTHINHILDKFIHKYIAIFEFNLLDNLTKHWLESDLFT